MTYANCPIAHNGTHQIRQVKDVLTGQLIKIVCVLCGERFK